MGTHFSVFLGTYVGRSVTVVLCSNSMSTCWRNYHFPKQLHLYILTMSLLQPASKLTKPRIFFVAIRKKYLKGRLRVGGYRMSILSSTNLFLKCLQWLGLRQTKATAYPRWQHLSLLSHHYCLPKSAQGGSCR